MNSHPTFASALPSARDERLIRRQAEELRAQHLRSLYRRLVATLTGVGDSAPGSLGERRA
jgi:hypothetical protein